MKKKSDSMVAAANNEAQAAVEVVMPQATPTEPPKLDTITKHPSKAIVSIGVWAYVVGLIIAVVAVPFVDEMKYYVYTVLAILGFIVGLLNITDEEVLLFLVACIAFVTCAAHVKSILTEWPTVVMALENIILFTAASAFIISLKAIIRVSRDE